MLWRRKGKGHLDPLRAWRQAEGEILSQNGKPQARPGTDSGKDRGTGPR